MKQQRMDITAVDPNALKAMMALSAYVKHTSVTPVHQELIKIRASQINGCAYCLDMHTHDARQIGITEQRLYTVSAWRDTPFFSKEEEAILALTEEVTLIQGHVSDETYNNAIALLGELYTAQVIMAVVLINGWNRIAISTNKQPELR